MTTGADERFTPLMRDVAGALLGTPNKGMSTKTELRFGRQGSVSIDLKTGQFFDHELKEGGGVIDLVKRERRCSDREAFDWLKDHFGLEDKPGTARPPLREPEPDRTAGAALPPGVPASHKLTKTYDYEAADGRLLFQVCRYEGLTDGKRTKTFRQRRPGERPGEWVWSVKGIEQVPYRIVEVVEAAAAEQIIFVVEGEKDAENLAREGVVATCNAMGAGKWPEELTAYFKGAHVVILPDNDEPGQKHRDLVAAALLPVAASVRVLELPGLPPKGDVSDWLAAGGSVDQLYDLVNSAARHWRPEDGFQSRFHAVRWADLDKPGPEHEWLIKGLLTRGERSMVAGPSQSGKSFAVLDMALAVARGVDFSAYAKIGGRSGWEIRAFKTRHGGVVYQAGEGGRGIKKRLRAYREHNQIPAAKDLPFVLLPSPVDLHANDDATNDLIAEIKHWASTFTVPLELVVIDTLSAATPGANENASEDMSRVLARCERIVQATGAHVMIVHHMNAAGEKPRGHSSIFANLDNAMVIRKVEGLREPPRERQGEDGGMETVPGREVREMVLTKQKDGEDGTTIRFVLKGITLGEDEDGDRISSCVVVPPNLGAEQETERGNAVHVNDKALVLLRAITRAIEEVGIEAPATLGLPRGVRVVTGGQMTTFFTRMTLEGHDEVDAGKREAIIKKAVATHGAMLLRKGVIARENPYVWLTGKEVRGMRTSRFANNGARSGEEPSNVIPFDAGARE